MKYLAMCFLLKGVQLTKNEISRFSKALILTQDRTKTTINPGIIDLENWRKMGAIEATYNKVKETTKIARKCGVLATYSCIPYLEKYL